MTRLRTVKLISRLLAKQNGHIFDQLHQRLQQRFEKEADQILKVVEREMSDFCFSTKGSDDD